MPLNGKEVNGKRAKAAGRIGVGTFAAIVIHNYVEMPENLHAPVTGVVILVVNELAYVFNLIWRKFVKKVEDW